MAVDGWAVTFGTARRDWAGPQPAQSPHRCTKCNSPPINPLNSAAQIVSNTRKFDRGLTHFRRSQLHWLDVVDWVRFRVCVQVFRCLHRMAPEYLSTYCQPVSGISGRLHLRSADSDSNSDILSVSKPSISQRSQIKEDTVEPSVPARVFNLKAYAAIT